MDRTESGLWIPGYGGMGGRANLAGNFAAKEFANFLNGLETGLDLIVHDQEDKRETEKNLNTMKKLGWITRDFQVFVSDAVPKGNVQPGNFRNQ